MQQFKRYRRSLLLTLAICLGLGSIIPIRLAVAQRQAPNAQAILVLEGQTARIRYAAKFATEHPNLPIWVSGYNPKGLSLNKSIFRQAGISNSQVHYDFCAIDTVTNFTCNVPEFKARNIQHVYVITSDYHMTRSLAIAALVFGSRGIIVTPITVTSYDNRYESPLRTVRDCMRSLVWIVTGRTGASLHRLL